MAAAPVSIAPALTPHTLSVLADTLDRVHLSEKAISLRKLHPFVESVVEAYFLPLVTDGGKGRFASRFNRLSRDFEPFRLYLNFKLLSTLDNREFLSFYEQSLHEILNQLRGTAREMDMAPELISAVVRDFTKVIRALCQSAEEAPSQSADLTVEQFTNMVDWFHTSTRFDYSLTAVVLVLERSIPKPASREKVALLSQCKRTFIEFGRATSRVAPYEHVRAVLSDLESPRIKVAPTRKGLRVVSPQLNSAKSQASSRQTEMSWVRRNKDLSERYGGQWIVLEKDELVASDPDYSKARGVATQRGIKKPFIIFVPPKESGGFMGL